MRPCTGRVAEGSLYTTEIPRKTKAIDCHQKEGEQKIAVGVDGFIPGKAQLTHDKITGATNDRASEHELMNSHGVDSLQANQRQNPAHSRVSVPGTDDPQFAFRVHGGYAPLRNPVSISLIPATNIVWHSTWHQCFHLHLSKPRLYVWSVESRWTICPPQTRRNADSTAVQTMHRWISQRDRDIPLSTYKCVAGDVEISSSVSCRGCDVSKRTHAATPLQAPNG